MSQIQEKDRINAFTCPNISCGQVFAKPLKALNLQKATRVNYDACPYCLTEITAEEDSMIISDGIKKPEPMATNEAEQHESHEESSECRYHIGFLSERSSKEQIPEGCMMCKDIVECMLKKMNL